MPKEILTCKTCNIHLCQSDAQLVKKFPVFWFWRFYHSNITDCEHFFVKVQWSLHFWDVKQCRLIFCYWRFGTTYWFHLQGWNSPRRLDFLASATNCDSHCLPAYTVQHPRRAKTFITPWWRPEILQGEKGLERGPVAQGRQTRWSPGVRGSAVLGVW